MSRSRRKWDEAWRWSVERALSASRTILLESVVKNVDRMDQSRGARVLLWLFGESGERDGGQVD